MAAWVAGGSASRAWRACSADTGWCCSRNEASSISASKCSWRQLGRCNAPPEAPALFPPLTSGGGE